MKNRSMREKIKEVIFRVFREFGEFKIPKQRILVGGVYLTILTVLRWGLKPDFGIIFFLMGGVLGIYFLEIAEKFFKVRLGEKSAFKNVLVQGVCLVLVFFVLTSSGSLFGSGMVLTLFLQMLFLQSQELKQTGNLNSWFWVIKTEVSPFRQKIYLSVISGIFILLNLLFV